MRVRDETAGRRIARGVVAGLIAGAAASLAMDRFQALAKPLLPPTGGDGEPATERAADGIARTVTGSPVPRADGPFAGQAIHYALGIGLGIFYGIAAEFRPAVSAGHGSAFGIGTATVLDEAMVPAVGLGAAPWKADLPTTVYSYASHLVFGVTTEIVRRQVAGTLIPRTDGDNA